MNIDIVKIVFLIVYVGMPIYIGFKYGLFRWIQRFSENERKMIDVDREKPNKANFIMYFRKKFNFANEDFDYDIERKIINIKFIKNSYNIVLAIFMVVYFLFDRTDNIYVYGLTLNLVIIESLFGIIDYYWENKDFIDKYKVEINIRKKNIE